MGSGLVHLSVVVGRSSIGSWLHTAVASLMFGRRCVHHAQRRHQKPSHHQALGWAAHPHNTLRRRATSSAPTRWVSSTSGLGAGMPGQAQHGLRLHFFMHTHLPGESIISSTNGRDPLGTEQVLSRQQGWLLQCGLGFLQIHWRPHQFIPAEHLPPADFPVCTGSWCYNYNAPGFQPPFVTLAKLTWCVRPTSDRFLGACSRRLLARCMLRSVTAVYGSSGMVCWLLLRASEVMGAQTRPTWGVRSELGSVPPITR
jgi:hypothetical protein